MLYYCNTVSWAWLDWGLSGWLTTFLQCFDTVGWVKNRRPYNLYCVGADVKHCSLTFFFSLAYAAVAQPLRRGIRCCVEGSETTFELVYRAAVNDVRHGLGGSTDACTVGCRCNHTDGDWLHIGQRLSGNGSECTTPVWAGWHQAREQLGHRWSRS